MKQNIDRVTARALVEAGYMPLRHYIEMFGDEVSSPSTAPDDADLHDHPPQRPSLIAQSLHLLHHD